MLTYESMNFEQRLKKRRIDLGLTREFVAARARTSAQSLWRWETGKGSPDAKSLRKLAEVLDCSIGYFFGESTIGNEVTPRAILESVTMLRERGRLSLEDVVRAALIPTAYAPRAGRVDAADDESKTAE